MEPWGALGSSTELRVRSEAVRSSDEQLDGEEYDLMPESGRQSPRRAPLRGRAGSRSSSSVLHMMRGGGSPSSLRRRSSLPSMLSICSVVRESRFCIYLLVILFVLHVNAFARVQLDG